MGKSQQMAVFNVLDDLPGIRVMDSHTLSAD